MPAEEWVDEERVRGYLARAADFPHRAEGERVLIDHLPADAGRVLDLGTGAGRLIGLVLGARPRAEVIGVDFSAPMLAEARNRFGDERRVELVVHDLDEPLPDLGCFDAVVSSFAIHHLEDDRKRALYGEVQAILGPGGPFANLEHVASPTARLHEAFFAAIAEPLENEDPSDRTVAVETQLAWLRESGFDDVDCYWKWLEMALLIGVKPA
jgi:ubiquinone/menaquinone biosynthesis C-methylase UbiE